MTKGSRRNRRVQMEKGKIGCNRRVGKKRVMGNTRRMKMYVDNYLECRKNGSRETGGWMRDRRIL